MQQQQSLRTNSDRIRTQSDQQSIQQDQQATRQAEEKRWLNSGPLISLLIKGIDFETDTFIKFKIFLDFIDKNEKIHLYSDKINKESKFIHNVPINKIMELWRVNKIQLESFVQCTIQVKKNLVYTDFAIGYQSMNCLINRLPGFNEEVVITMRTLNKKNNPTFSKLNLTYFDPNIPPLPYQITKAPPTWTILSKYLCTNVDKNGHLVFLDLRNRNRSTLPLPYVQGSTISSRLSIGPDGQFVMLQKGETTQMMHQQIQNRYMEKPRASYNNRELNRLISQKSAIENGLYIEITNNMLVFFDSSTGFRTLANIPANLAPLSKLHINSSGLWYTESSNSQQRQNVNGRNQNAHSNQASFNNLPIERMVFLSNTDNNERLPTHWEIHMDSRTKKIYYFHRISQIYSEHSPTKYQSQTEQAALEWQIIYCNNYRRFVNVFTGQISMSDPRVTVSSKVKQINDTKVSERKKQKSQLTGGHDEETSNQNYLNNDLSQRRANNDFMTLVLDDFTRKTKILEKTFNLNLIKTKVRFEVNSEDPFEKLCNQLARITPREIKKIFTISFRNQVGLDYGALLNEFIQNTSSEFYKMSRNMFVPISPDSETLTLNPGFSNFDFETAYGVLFAIALFHNKNLSYGPSVIFYKVLLRRKIMLEDVYTYDPAFYKNLSEIKNEEIDDLDLGLTFSVEATIEGKRSLIDLIPNGSRLEVTDANKLQYISLLIDWEYIGKVYKQINRIRSSIENIIPMDFLDMFTSREVEFLTCGKKSIDVDDWEANTNYYGGFSASSKVIKMFWKYVRSLPTSKRTLLKQFATGSAAVPAGGFADLRSQNSRLKFSIKKTAENVPAGVWPLPIAHACFNRLEMPNYPTYEILEEKITTAINETNTYEMK